MRVAITAITFASACHTTTPLTPVTCGSGTMTMGMECVAPDACGAGTHDDHGTCVADPQTTTSYAIRVAPMLAADGATAYDVFAFGTQPDGSPATDMVVLNTDRAGAGTYERPQLTLGALGAYTRFVPCANSVPGCTGPLALTLALASTPTVPIAHFETNVVDPASIDPARACLTGGNTLVVQGNDQIFNGSATITSGTWNQSMAGDTVEIDVAPTNPAQGGPWVVKFSSAPFGISLPLEHFPNVQRWQPGGMTQLQGALLVTNNGMACNTITGDFTIETFTPSPGPSAFTAVFEQHCNGSTTTSLSGCVHWAP